MLTPLAITACALQPPDRSLDDLRRDLHNPQLGQATEQAIIGRGRPAAIALLGDLRQGDRDDQIKILRALTLMPEDATLCCVTIFELFQTSFSTTGIDRRLARSCLRALENISPFVNGKDAEVLVGVFEEFLFNAGCSHSFEDLYWRVMVLTAAIADPTDMQSCLADLGGSDPESACIATLRLARMGPHNVAAVPALAAYLHKNAGDPYSVEDPPRFSDFDQRASSLAARESSDAKPQDLEFWMTQWTCDAVAQALVTITPLDSASIRAHAMRLKSPGIEYRREAAKALGLFAAEARGALPRLRQVAEDEDPILRAYARRSMRLIEDSH